MVSKIEVRSLLAQSNIRPTATLANKMARILGKWDISYHRGEPEVPDATWDRVRDALKRIAPKHKYLKIVGAPVAKTTAGEKVRAGKEQLPITVGSLDKLRPAEVLTWMKGVEKVQPQRAWLCMPKFDGQSLTLKYDDCKYDRAWTRGDGTIGRNVTAAAQHIQGVRPSVKILEGDFDTSQPMLVRGEAVMHKSIFEKFYANADSDIAERYKTPRNLVAGLTNRIDVKGSVDDLRRCTFVALQLFTYDKRRKIWVRPDDAHREWVLLNLMGFTTFDNPARYAPGHQKILRMVKDGHRGLRKLLPVFPTDTGLGKLVVFEQRPTEKEIVERLHQISKALDIAIDGLVISPVNIGKFVKRGEHLEARPPFMKAIKLEAHDQESLEGKVGAIEWNISKRGLLKPRLILRDTLVIDGVDVDHATCNNAAWITKWGLRPGRRIRMVRSGGVIPRIIEVYADGKWVPLRKKVTKLQRDPETKEKVRVAEWVDGDGIVDPKIDASIPKRCPACGSRLHATEKRTDLECRNDKCAGRRDKSVLAFFRELKVDDVAAGTIDHMVAAGMDTVPKILRGATIQRLRRLEGYGDRKAANVAQNIAGALKDKPLAMVMHASGIFSNAAFALGTTRLQSIIDHVGVGKIARANKDRLRRDLATLHGLGEAGLALFLERIDDWRAFYEGVADLHTESSGPKTLRGVRVAFTGFRDPEAEAYVIKHGGSHGGVSKNTTVLFAASLGSGKSNKADKLGVPTVKQSQMWEWLKKRGGK